MLSEARILSRVCPRVSELSVEFSRGAGAVLLTEEIVWADQSGEIGRALRTQEPWSMIPLLLISRDGGPESLQKTALERYPGVTVLEKPVRPRALVGAVRSALRARANQLQVRDLLRDRERQSAELAEQDEKLRAALDAVSKQAEQLRSRDRLKDQFLATLAHELRNPLAPITTGLSVLEANQDPRAERTLAVIRRQVRHMVRLIDDLLDVSRITTGKLELKMERFAIRSAIEAAVEAASPALTRGEHALKVDLPEQDSYLLGDQTRVAQVISNLLNNASKYTPPGGHVELAVHRDATQIVITVRDDGVGIPAERLEEVFEMFAQIEQPSDRSQGGLGIGLALVRRLVEMHGGSVGATSEGLGQGSTFTVRLPATEIGAETGERTEAAPLSVLTGKRRVLIVDDNEDAREMLAVLLEQAGYETSTAEDGPHALEAARATVPNIVILDIGLPGMSGYEVATSLRQLPGFSSTVIIALSGWGSPEDKRRAQEAGFDLHLTKPVFADQLSRALGALQGVG
jgi:signal transduction histidine kinase